MNNKPELVNILRAELTLLTKDILQKIHQKDITDIYKATRKLYEKTVAIHVLQKHLSADELSGLLTQEEKTPASSSERDEIFINKDVLEEKGAVPSGNPYKNAGKMSFKPKDTRKETTQSENPSQVRSSSSRIVKKMSIGLNDRIAFIKNLFEGDAEAYARAVDKLNAFESYEEALTYISDVLKPAYNNWEGKDEYEFRLIQLLELKFN